MYSFLKIKGKRYVPRKSKTFTTDKVARILDTARDEKFLVHKIEL